MPLAEPDSDPVTEPADAELEGPPTGIEPEPSGVSRSRLLRFLGALGTSFIIVGLLVFGFAAFLLWGTGIRAHQEQETLKDQFEVALEQAAATTTTPPTTAVPGTSRPSATTTSVQPVAPIDLTPGNGPLARIEIPSIGVDSFAVEGVDLGDLKKGPGHYRGTPFPGQPGNVAFAGHRTTYGAPFSRVAELNPGDQIVVTTIQGRFVYEVTGQEIVSPSDITVIDDKGDNRLTLTSCHPKFSASKRIVISAVLTTEPIPPSPVTAAPPGATELGPDEATPGTLTAAPGHLGDTLLAGSICAALALGAWQVGVRLLRRWRWLLYLAVAPLFLAVLFFFYEDLASLLPSDF